MADQNDKKISKEIKRIAGVDDSHFPLMRGIVKSIDSDNEITVKLTNNDETAPTTEITLSVLSENFDGYYGIPSVGADCIICEIDGPGKYELLKASKYDSVIINANTVIKMNGGVLKGLVKLDDLVTRLNILEKDNNKLKKVFDTWAVVANDGGAALKTAAATWTASTLTETSGADIENPNIKQG